MPGRESSSSEPPARLALERDAAASTDLVEPERRERGSRGGPDAPSARGKALRVDVVDAGGRPAAGVPIACGLVSPSRREVFEVRLRASSDAQGSTWIELPESTDAPDASLRLRAEILARTVPELALERGVVGQEPVVFPLPPTGSVRLVVADALGRATPTPARFAVWARAEGATRDVEPLPRWVSAPDGVAVLEHVGLGLELRVAAVIDGEGAREERVVGQGPRFSGEVRTIQVSIGAEWPIVLVRARDEHGNLLRNELLDAEVRWNRPEPNPLEIFGISAASPPRRVRTDVEGRARFPLRGTVAGGFTRRLVLTHRDGDGEGGVLRSAERDLSFDAPAGGEIDLGDVELRPRERPEEMTWASGVVADPAGNPVGTATVLVSAIDAEGMPLRSQAARVTVEHDGRFVVTGPRVEHRLSVRAVAPGFLRSTEVVVVPGASDLRVRMQAAARWEGRLRLDPDILPEDLVVDVITPERRQRTTPTSERITIDGLEEGWVDVEVRTRTGDWLVERWERLPTSAAGTPQTYELDLRGRLTRLRLELTELDGTPLDRVFARVHPEPWPEGDGWIRAGRLELVVPREVRTILVEPRGHAPVAVEPHGSGLQSLAVGPSPAR